MNERLKKRIFSCIEAVLDVHEVLGDEGFGDEVLEEIEYARERLQEIHFLDISEDQVIKIEEATNKLLEVLNHISKIHGIENSILRVNH